MQHITGTDRLQLSSQSLEQQMSQDNPVRVMDAFVEKLDLKKLGFVYKELKSEGRPSLADKMYVKWHHRSVSRFKVYLLQSKQHLHLSAGA